jgi:hypothetical protein
MSDKKKFTCSICNNEYKSENRLNNHFKVCNYSNLEKKITILDFNLFSMICENNNLKSENNNLKSENNNLKSENIIFDTHFNNLINES